MCWVQATDDKMRDPLERVKELERRNEALESAANYVWRGARTIMS
jgi:hypothetical protein